MDAALTQYTSLWLLSFRSVNGVYRIGLFALKDITSGTELTYDYNFHSFNTEEQVSTISDLLIERYFGYFMFRTLIAAMSILTRLWPFSQVLQIIAIFALYFSVALQQVCKCGSESCRGIIGGKSQRINGLPGKTGGTRRLGRLKEKRKSKHQLKKRVSDECK